MELVAGTCREDRFSHALHAYGKLCWNPSSKHQRRLQWLAVSGRAVAERLMVGVLASDSRPRADVAVDLHDVERQSVASRHLPARIGLCVACWWMGAAANLLRSIGVADGTDEPHAAQAFDRPYLSLPHHTAVCQRCARLSV